MAERVQKLMSQAGLGSRRDNESLISSGRVTVNGRTVRLGDKADPLLDVIRVDGKRVAFGERVYIKLYKPKGVISSTEDELAAGRPTVRDLVKIPGFLYPVGRLDKQSEGLMILTNDGQITHRLTHPSFQHTKLYQVDVVGEITDNTLNLWRQGVLLDGQRTAKARIEVIRRRDGNSRLQVTLREGRKRQIRRVASSLGYPVTKLIRLRIGPITLGPLKSGEWRHLSDGELSDLWKEVYG